MLHSANKSNQSADSQYPQTLLPYFSASGSWLKQKQIRNQFSHHMGARWDIFFWFMRNFTPRYSMHSWQYDLIINLAFWLFERKWGYEVFLGSWNIWMQKHIQANISYSINFQNDLVQDMILLACHTNWNHCMYLCIELTFWR